MGGSIHIHGTTSSIIDTVFVCRSSGTTPEAWLFDTPGRLMEVVGEDLEQLACFIPAKRSNKFGEFDGQPACIVRVVRPQRQRIDP